MVLSFLSTLPLPPQGWDYRCAAPLQVYATMGNEPRAFYTLGKDSTHWATSPTLLIFCYQNISHLIGEKQVSGELTRKMLQVHKAKCPSGTVMVRDLQGVFSKHLSLSTGLIHLPPSSGSFFSALQLVAPSYSFWLYEDSAYAGRLSLSPRNQPHASLWQCLQVNFTWPEGGSQWVS